LSYSHRPDAALITKTRWNADIVEKYTGIRAEVVGPSVDLDRFQPRKKKSDKIAVAAMLRPSTPRRAAARTLRCAQKIQREFGDRVQFHFFGCDKPELDQFQPDIDELMSKSEFYGVLNTNEVAALLSTVNIFCDLSDHQAMGLTALEAMASGCAVVVPINGGSVEFAKADLNALIIDSTNEDLCFDAVRRLISSPDLRHRLASQAVEDARNYAAEVAARNILAVVKRGKA
jgi:glycosyltransferase involved in cell wall biosynthesis